MKAYPLIYSRTKNVDFVPDFLTRPEDLDVYAAMPFVQRAMKDLDFSNTIRYTVFRAGDYCICGGIACVSKVLLDELLKTKKKSMEEYTEAETFLRDCKGRSISCFIGLAFKKADVPIGIIPEVNLKTYWDIYLKHLKKQWNADATFSEKVTEPIDIQDKLYPNKNIQTVIRDGKRVIRRSDYNIQDILDCYFYKILHTDSSEWIISDVRNPHDFYVFDGLQNTGNTQYNNKSHVNSNSSQRSRLDAIKDVEPHRDDNGQQDFDIEVDEPKKNSILS